MISDRATPGGSRRLVLDAVDLPALEGPHRLDGLARSNLLDAAARANLDRLVRLACDLLEAPIGLLSLIETNRQFFVASHGLPEPMASARHTSLDYSLCQRPVASGQPLIVGDLRDEPVLAANRAVTEMGVLAYAGIPTVDLKGQAFGTFCVIDLAVRDWDDYQLATLARLADIATEVCLWNNGGSEFEEAPHVASATR